MRILVEVHGYQPVHNAGAEWALHGLLTALAARGHEIVVYAPTLAQEGVFDGITVRTSIPPNAVEYAATFDALLTHLDLTADVRRLADRAHRPLIQYIHNDSQMRFHRSDNLRDGLVIYNTDWIARACPTPGLSCVVHPPIDADRYRVEETGDCITLLNLNDNKGADIFWELARRMPQYQFLGVKGSYGTQIVPKPLPDNATVLANTPDVRGIFARTRLLLMPSAYESWGRAAMEAAASGIPTIAHPTPGLLECLQTGGIYADRGDINAWEEAIIETLERYYQFRSQSASVRWRLYLDQLGCEIDALDYLLALLPDHYVYANAHLPERFFAVRPVILSRIYRPGEQITEEHPRLPELVARGAVRVEAAT
jgi:glycosyltransferase involved in cell wall biosynthesis